MFEAWAIINIENAVMSHSRISRVLTQRLSFLTLLLAAALMTTSCGTLAQGAGAQNALHVSGTLPAGTVHRPTTPYSQSVAEALPTISR